MTATARAAKIRLLCLDVDGTLTDGKLYYTKDFVGRAFHVLDGFAIKRFIKAGGVVAIISAAQSSEGDAIHRRAESLGIQYICIDVTDKLQTMRQVMAAAAVTAEETAFAGDDLPDLSAMQAAGFAVAPKTAVPEVQAIAHYVPERPAGGGAVWEICEFIMRARGASAPADEAQ